MDDELTLTVRREQTADTTILYCAGRLVTTTAHLLSAEVKPLLVAGGNISIDLSGVTFMDSMGLGTVASLWVSSKSRSCRLALINLSPRLRDLFTVTHLLSLFEPCGEANVRIP